MLSVPLVAALPRTNVHHWWQQVCLRRIRNIHNPFFPLLPYSLLPLILVVLRVTTRNNQFSLRSPQLQKLSRTKVDSTKRWSVRAVMAAVCQAGQPGGGRGLASLSCCIMLKCTVTLWDLLPRWPCLHSEEEACSPLPYLYPNYLGKELIL